MQREVSAPGMSGDPRPLPGHLVDHRDRVGDIRLDCVGGADGGRGQAPLLVADGGEHVFEQIRQRVQIGGGHAGAAVKDNGNWTGGALAAPCSDRAIPRVDRERAINHTAILSRGVG